MGKLRKIFRLLALMAAVGVIGFWVSRGAHTGWSMNKVPVTLVDEFTEIEYVVYEDRYVPGIEIVGGGILTSIIIFSFTFLPSGKKS